MMKLPKLVVVLIVLIGSLATGLSHRAHGIPCLDFSFNVSTVSFNDSGFIQPAASYLISATYCPPTVSVHHRASTVQLLIPGGTRNKQYWSALGPVGSPDQYQPGNYSYIDFVRAKGYHIIAIDRLGTGNSTHPDPTVVRLGLQAELTHTIINEIRQHHVPSSVPLFDKLIVVGHSLGSFIVNIMLNKYPQAVDCTILTGFAHVFSNALPAIRAQEFAPASTVFPARFGSLDSRYLTQSNETNSRENFYGPVGSFDPQLAALQYSREDVQSVYEQESIRAVLQGPYATQTTNYSRPLAFMIGQNDQVYCRGDCGTGNSSLLAQSQPFYPNATLYTGFLLPNTGNLLTFHYSALSGFQLLHDWLVSAGF